MYFGESPDASVEYIAYIFLFLLFETEYRCNMFLRKFGLFPNCTTCYKSSVTAVPSSGATLVVGDRETLAGRPVMTGELLGSKKQAVALRCCISY
jgi:hypothetical protein